MFSMIEMIHSFVNDHFPFVKQKGQATPEKGACPFFLFAPSFGQISDSFSSSMEPHGQSPWYFIKYPPAPRLRTVIRLQRNPPKQHCFSS
jgi:hypothetical protein